MRKITIGCVLALLSAVACSAQGWEVGGMASYGFYRTLDVTNPVGSAVAGLSPGTAFGAVVGHNAGGLLGGEFRYSYEMSDLKLSSGGTDVKFAGMAHILGYDLVLHRRPKHGAKILPFLAVGGGMKIYRGTGTEQAYQPLSDIALLSKTQEIKPMISAGGGVKLRLGQRVILRAAWKSAITSPHFLRQVITPLPGTKVSGWLKSGFGPHGWYQLHLLMA